MALSNAAVRKTIEDVWRANTTERYRLNRYVRYARGKQKLPWLPDNVEGEYKDIAAKSASNWLGLVVNSTTQGLFVDGYGSPEAEEAAADAAEGSQATTGGSQSLWDAVWQPNGMDSRQAALHEAVVVCGYAGLIVFPGSETGTVWVRPESATNLAFVFDDPSDDWPRLVVRQVTKNRFELYDSECRYTMQVKGRVRTITKAEHTAGVCPVVYMRRKHDLLGTPQGEVEPVISIQDRIVDATFTLQMVAKYGAFPQRWIAGIDTTKPLVGEDGEPLKDGQGNLLFPTIKAYVDSILTAVDPETKFGQFAAADLTQYVSALEAHIRHLAAITQTPPHYLLGALVNLSAEALAAAESGLQRKIAAIQVALGEGYEQAMRLAGAILGNKEAADDTSSQVHWKDVESRSLAQTSDALVKLQSLGVPAEVLLPMIPGLSQQDVKTALIAIERGGGLAQIVSDLARAQLDTPAAA